ncbi:hypothetical protein ACLMJK_008540 [Lecanora helva]
MGAPEHQPLHEDESRQGGIIATAILVTVIACIFVALRFVTRIWIVRSVGWDDYTILFATFGVIIGTGLDCVLVHYGTGRHKYYLKDWEYIENQKYSYGEWIQTFQTLMFTKISICFFLLRIPVKKYFIRPIQVAIVALIVSNIVLTLLWILQCNPVARAWNKQTPGTCFTDAQLQRIIISQAIISAISDVVLALFPIALLWKVKIELRIKMGLCALMGLGLITVTASIASYRSHRSSRNTSLETSDKTASSGKVFEGQGSVAYSAAAQTMSKEADRAQAFGAGEETFGMKHLPGDRKTVDEGIKKPVLQGIKKTTEIDVSGISESSQHGSHGSLDLNDVERGMRTTDFF